MIGHQSKFRSLLQGVAMILTATLLMSGAAVAAEKEGPPQTTWDNPLVTVWEKGDSKDYPEQGLVGHMHLTTAQNIHGFGILGLAAQLKKAGVGKRIKAGKVHLELSKWTKKEISAQTPLSLTRKQVFKKISTRKYYEGRHEVHVQINGKVVAQADFTLVM